MEAVYKAQRSKPVGFVPHGNAAGFKKYRFQMFLPYLLMATLSLYTRTRARVYAHIYFFIII